MSYREHIRNEIIGDLSKIKGINIPIKTTIDDSEAPYMVLDLGNETVENTVEDAAGQTMSYSHSLEANIYVALVNDKSSLHSKNMRESEFISILLHNIYHKLAIADYTEKVENTDSFRVNVYNIQVQSINAAQDIQDINITYIRFSVLVKFEIIIL